jgi:hypothetical protein
VPRPKEDPSEFGLEFPPPEHDHQPLTEVRRSQARAGQFVQRTYRLVPLTELQDDSYGPGGPCSGSPKPKFNEVLVSERYFEGIG